MEGLHTQEAVERSRIEKIDSGWIDRVRHVTYPTLFVLGFLSSEKAVAAEIPMYASLEQGISVLEHGARTENFETAGAFISLPDEKPYWISAEGDTQTVSLFAEYEGKDGDVVSAFLTEIIEKNSLDFGQTVKVDYYHNHPMQSLFPGYNGPEFSIPPSGMGFLTEGDTGFTKYDLFADAIDEVEASKSVSIDFQWHVVDAVGTWTWSYIDQSSLEGDPVFQARQRLQELYLIEESGERADSFEERQSSEAIVESARERFRNAYDQWLDSSHSPGSPELESLINEYRLVGIEMRFKRHDHQ